MVLLSGLMDSTSVQHGRESLRHMSAIREAETGHVPYKASWGCFPPLSSPRRLRLGLRLPPELFKPVVQFTEAVQYGNAGFFKTRPHGDSAMSTDSQVGDGTLFMIESLDQFLSFRFRECERE